MSRGILRGLPVRLAARHSKGFLLVGKGARVIGAHHLTLGRNVKIEDFAEVQCRSHRGVVLGDGVTIGRNVSIRPSSYYGHEAGEGPRAPSRFIVALPRRGVLADRFEALGATVEIGELDAALRADLAPGRFGKFLHKARRGARFVESLVKRHGVDIVHTNTTVLIDAAYGAHRSSADHVWHVHEILDQPTWARFGVRSLIKRWADVAIANSRATAAAMLDPDIGRAHTIYNGVSHDRSDVDLIDRLEIRRGLGIGSDERLAVLPGRVNSWKGHRLVLDAAEAIGDACPRIVFAGSPPPGQEHVALRLDAEIRDRGLAGRITRIPFTEDLPSLLAADHGGLQEIVIPGVTGALFRPGSAAALAASLRDLLADSERLTAMGVAARERPRSTFTHETYAAEMLGVYESIMAPWVARVSDLRAA